jgi:hypothetical protein
MGEIPLRSFEQVDLVNQAVSSNAMSLALFQTSTAQSAPKFSPPIRRLFTVGQSTTYPHDLVTIERRTKVKQMNNRYLKRHQVWKT